MKSLTVNFGRVLLAAGVIFLSSCNKDDDDSSGNNGNQKDETVKETLESEDDMARMNEAVEESNTSDFFSRTDANVTLFAASNEAWDELFAKVGVNSMSELESSMGEENFRNMVLYLAVDGKLSISGFENGFYETKATHNNDAYLDVHIDAESSSMLRLNGGDENGAATADGETFSLNNGNIIMINSVIMAQSNYENIEESESESSLFAMIMADVDASIHDYLQSETEQSTVFVADNDQAMESMLSINLSHVLSVSMLDQLLDEQDETTLFNELGVNTLIDLLVQIRLNDLLNVGITVDQILQVMGQEGKTDLMQSLIIDGNVTRDDMTERENITTMAGIDFDINTNTEGNFVLTDNDGNQIILDGDHTQSINGSIYTVLEVREAE